jgi:hypothetical protein
MPGLLKIGFRNRPPHVVGKMAAEQFIEQINGPEYVVDNQQQYGMIVIPADHERINAQY